MRPLAALLAILTGSALALTIGLVLTFITILFLPAEQARFGPEHQALLKAIAVFDVFSATIGLVLTFITILFLPAEQARFAPEHPALLKAIAVFGVFSAIAGASLYAEMRERGWAVAAHLATLGAFAVAVWAYWPK